MKKIILSGLLFFLLTFSANAKSFNKEVDSIIKDSGIPKSSVAISIKDIQNNKTVYETNENILMHPASVQKMLTIIPIMEVLGDNYEFTTAIYKHNNSEYVIKLGADPYLTTSDLNTLVKNIDSSTAKKIYIDDTIIEQKDWGEGWQWDDDLNTYMLRFNAYNLDDNIYKITIMPTKEGQPALIINQNKAPVAFYNNVITGKKNDITISRDNVSSPNMLKIDGTVSSPVIKSITNNNLRRYFESKLTGVLEDNRIYLKEPYGHTKINSGDKLLKTVSHKITQAEDDILLNSSNMAVETLSKIASGKYYNKQGTDIDAVKLFYDYCQKQKLDTTRIRLTDASGVSKNNLIDAEFITEFLVLNKDNTVMDKLASPQKGTLAKRMIPLKDNLKAKTGTLADISSISGFLTSRSGRKYAFCIITNDPSSSEYEKKNLEDYLIREMFLKL